LSYRAADGCVVLHADTRRQQFDAALVSQDVIGQAKGMVMQDYNIDADAAFERIRRTWTPTPSSSTSPTVSLPARAEPTMEVPCHAWTARG